MKRVSVLVVALLVLTSVTCFAGSNSDHGLKQLGFPEDTIRFLSDTEKQVIIQNQYEFLGSTKAYTLYVEEEEKPNYSMSVLSGTQVQNDSKRITAYPVSEKDFREYKRNPEAFVKSKVEGSQTRNRVYAARVTGSTVTSWGIHKLYLDAYNASSSERDACVLGLNFEWIEDPIIFWEDIAAIYHNGESLGLTACYASDFYIKNKYGHTFYSEPDYTDGGLYAKFMMRDGARGRLWAMIGNRKGVCQPNGEFNVWGRYGHSTIGIGSPTVSFSTSGISFGASGGLIVSDSNQAKLSAISINDL